MNKELILKIDRAIDECTEQLARDTIKLVNIKSVESKPLPGAPFGSGVKEVLDSFCDMADNAGFYCTDYNVGIISAAMKMKRRTLEFSYTATLFPRETVGALIHTQPQNTKIA